MENETKYCVNCKHFMLEQRLCGRPNDKIDLVLGTFKKRLPTDAYYERDNLSFDTCGPNAKYYKEISKVDGY